VAKGLALKAVGAEFVSDAGVFDLLAGGEFDDHGDEQLLLFEPSGGALAEHLFKENAFVGDVLIDDPEAVAAGGDDEAFVELADGAEVFEDIEAGHAVELHPGGGAAVMVGDFEAGGGGVDGRGRGGGRGSGGRGGSGGESAAGEGGEVGLGDAEGAGGGWRGENAAPFGEFEAGVFERLGELGVG
jgi:hypothetical protein